MTTRARGTRWLALVVALALVAAGPAHGDPSRTSLAAAIDRIIEDPALAHAFWGIQVLGLESGRVLYERNADKGFRPASTLKLVTTAASLDAFGPGARVDTTVETAARLDGQGRLLGDLLLVGRGDPGLSGRFGEGPPTAAFETMADTLLETGVRRVEGRLVGHEGAFGGGRRGPDWMVEDLAWGYGAEVSALTFNDNVVHVTLAPGERPGDPAALEVVPRTSFVRVVSAVVTAPAGTEEDVVLRRPLGSNHIRLSGVLPRGGEWEEDVAVEDPARFAITAFREVLEARGIAVMGEVTTSSEPVPGDARVLVTHEGVPMARWIEEINKESQNLHAELLLRLLGQRTHGEGTREKGIEAVEAFLDRLEVPRAGWHLEDGSGLSHTNVVTPRGLAALLAAMDRHPRGEVAQAFRASLPVAGASGKLAERMRGTPAEARVAAKTGALKSVNELAGYVTNESGARLVFVLLVNDHVELSATARAAIDEVVIALAAAR